MAETVFIPRLESVGGPLEEIRNPGFDRGDLGLQLTGFELVGVANVEIESSGISSPQGLGGGPVHVPIQSQHFVTFIKRLLDERLLSEKRGDRFKYRVFYFFNGGSGKFEENKRVSSGGLGGGECEVAPTSVSERSLSRLTSAAAGGCFAWFSQWLPDPHQSITIVNHSPSVPFV
ncbi:MAG: hypothetical protein ACJASX_000315 [Limisphaerales bacterium]|jgi:hypothetical protein